MVQIQNQIASEVKMTNKLNNEINKLQVDGELDNLIGLDAQISIHSHKANVLKDKSMWDEERQAVHEKFMMENLAEQNHEAIAKLEKELKGIHYMNAKMDQAFEAINNDVIDINEVEKAAAQPVNATQ